MTTLSSASLSTLSASRPTYDRAAAARAGVDLSSRASIDAADRLWSARQAAELARR